MVYTNCLLIIILFIFVIVNLKTSKTMLENFTNQSDSIFIKHKRDIQKNVWNEFCVQNPPPCQMDNDMLIQRNPPIGCWCKDQKSTFCKEEKNDIHRINYDPFAAFRR